MHAHTHGCSKVPYTEKGIQTCSGLYSTTILYTYKHKYEYIKVHSFHICIDISLKQQSTTQFTRRTSAKSSYIALWWISSTACTPSPAWPLNLSEK